MTSLSIFAVITTKNAKMIGMKRILIAVLALLQFTAIVRAADAPVPPAPVPISTLNIDQLNMRLTGTRTALTGIANARKQALDNIEARYIKDKEERTKFFQVKEDEFKAREKEILDAIAKTKK
jgi:hypothetical protein